MNISREDRGKPDVQVENHGTIFLVRALSTFAANWIEEHVSDDGQFFGGALLVEHRYIADLVAGMREAGLVVR